MQLQLRSALIDRFGGVFVFHALLSETCLLDESVIVRFVSYLRNFGGSALFNAGLMQDLVASC